MGTLLIALLYLYGIAAIAIGVLSIFATDLVRKKVFKKIMNIKDFKRFGIIPIIAAILFLLAIPYNRHKFFILLLGILAAIKGILMIAATEKMEKVRDWWLKASDSVYRAYGVVAIIIGSIVLMGI